MTHEDDKPDLIGTRDGLKNNAEEHKDNSDDIEELENFLETALEDEQEQEQEQGQEQEQEQEHELRVEDLPKRADGTIDVASLTPEQHKVYTA